MLTCWWMKYLRKLAERKKDVSVFQGFLRWLAAFSTGAWGRTEHCNSWNLSPRGCSLHGDKETKTWGKGEGVLQEPPSRVLLGRRHACFPYFGSYLLQFPVSPRSPFSYKYIGGLTHPTIQASLKSAIQIQTITGFYAMYSNIFLNGLCAPVLYLFYICFKENSRFIVDIISFLFSSYTNPWFTSVKKFSILGVLERWLSG